MGEELLASEGKLDCVTVGMLVGMFVAASTGAIVGAVVMLTSVGGDVVRSPVGAGVVGSVDGCAETSASVGAVLLDSVGGDVVRSPVGADVVGSSVSFAPVGGAETATVVGTADDETPAEGASVATAMLGFTEGVKLGLMLGVIPGFELGKLLGTDDFDGDTEGMLVSVSTNAFQNSSSFKSRAPTTFSGTVVSVSFKPRP